MWGAIKIVSRIFAGPMVAAADLILIRQPRAVILGAAGIQDPLREARS